jgi:hypothetical protein
MILLLWTLSVGTPQSPECICCEFTVETHYEALNTLSICGISESIAKKMKKAKCHTFKFLEPTVKSAFLMLALLIIIVILISL